MTGSTRLRFRCLPGGLRRKCLRVQDNPYQFGGRGQQEDPVPKREAGTVLVGETMGRRGCGTGSREWDR